MGYSEEIKNCFEISITWCRVNVAFTSMASIRLPSVSNCMCSSRCSLLTGKSERYVMLKTAVVSKTPNYFPYLKQFSFALHTCQKKKVCQVLSSLLWRCIETGCRSRHTWQPTHQGWRCKFWSLHIRKCCGSSMHFCRRQCRWIWLDTTQELQSKLGIRVLVLASVFTRGGLSQNHQLH